MRLLSRRARSPPAPCVRDKEQLDEKHLSARNRCRRCAHGRAQRRRRPLIPIGKVAQPTQLTRRLVPDAPAEPRRQRIGASAHPLAAARHAAAQRDVEKLRRQADLDARVKPKHQRRRAPLFSVKSRAFTGIRRLTCTPERPRPKGTFLLCQRGDISTLP